MSTQILPALSLSALDVAISALPDRTAHPWLALGGPRTRTRPRTRPRPRRRLAYAMQAVDHPDRCKTNRSPKWAVPFELIEWQPVYHQVGTFPIECFAKGLHNGDCIQSNYCIHNTSPDGDGSFWANHGLETIETVSDIKSSDRFRFFRRLGVARSSWAARVAARVPPGGGLSSAFICRGVAIAEKLPTATATVPPAHPPAGGHNGDCGSGVFRGCIMHHQGIGGVRGRRWGVL
jgi:hypothetical protein